MFGQYKETLPVMSGSIPEQFQKSSKPLVEVLAPVDVLAATLLVILGVSCTTKRSGSSSWLMGD